MRAILIGAPGAGKGTQAKSITKRFAIPHIASGDMLRQAVDAATLLGKQAEAYMQRGELVPDNLVIEMILLDGFPRTLQQAKALHSALAKLHVKIDHVLYLDVPDEEIIIRSTARRIDPKTGKIYNLKFKPPPKSVQSRLIQRSDDEESTLRNRLVSFHEQTKPMIPFYEEQGLIRKISGLGSLDEVQLRLLNAIR
jgi:adenylate kinase